MKTASDALTLNLRRIRLERAMSLSALARAAQVSKATVSGLERGNGNPSIDIVWALAQALRVPFGALFEEDSHGAIAVRRIHDAPTVASEPGFTGRHLLSRGPRGVLEFYVLDIDRGTARNAAPHPPGVIEHVIVLEGRVDVGPSGESTVLGPGDCMTFPADRPHHYHAVDGRATVLSLTDYPA